MVPSVSFEVFGYFCQYKSFKGIFKAEQENITSGVLNLMDTITTREL
jgi:hypothetical protein